LPFDASVDLQGLHKSAIVGWMSRAKSRFGPEAVAVSEPAVQWLYSHQVKGSKAEGLALRARYLAGAALGFDALSYPMDSGIRRWPRRKCGQRRAGQSSALGLAGRKTCQSSCSGALNRSETLPLKSKASRRRMR
jgi:hypothetical protein